MKNKRWSVIVGGHVAQTTHTKRGADGWTKAARDSGFDARTERTQPCKRCGLHKCGAGECAES